jgi:hypothetical protein
MAIAKNPKRNTSADKEREAEAFISGAGLPPATLTTANPLGVGQGAVKQFHDASEERDSNKKPIMVRVDPEMLKRIDRAAKRLGISRSAFIVSSAAERLERME